MDWDPTQYNRYAGERGRPFLDLLARVESPAPRRVVDLGCGPGTLTRLLSQRWPASAVEGLDSSPEMIAAAGEVPGVAFRVGDVRSFSPAADTDVLISNATLQWVPGHESLLRAWAHALAPGAVLAWQVPGNFDAPSHRLMRELAGSPRWRDQLAGVLRHGDAVRTPAGYAELLLDAGWQADAWETTYLHLLPGEDPVLDWVRGTGLRPVLAELGDDAGAFEAEYAETLRAAYPRGAHGTVFAFRRIFCVGRKP